MRFLRKIEAVTRTDNIRNTVIQKQVNVSPIETVIEQRQLGWMVGVYGRGENNSTERTEAEMG